MYNNHSREQRGGLKAPVDWDTNSSVQLREFVAIQISTEQIHFNNTTKSTEAHTPNLALWLLEFHIEYHSITITSTPPVLLYKLKYAKE